jgi:hypothetical protein
MIAPPKVNSPSMKDLNDSEVDEISNNELKRIMNEIKEKCTYICVYVPE